MSQGKKIKSLNLFEIFFSWLSEWSNPIRKSLDFWWVKREVEGGREERGFHSFILRHPNGALVGVGVEYPVGVGVGST